jgi:NAD(P)-dependent dehydrogenase (short-subunit alcohol dehydrogenase family)
MILFTLYLILTQQDSTNWRSIMNGKICMVTGATAGIGKSTAAALARMGAAVVVVGRNEGKCVQTITEIRTTTNSPEVDYLVADLSVQNEIRRLAVEFKARYPRLDVLVNNAGAAFLKRGLTQDGIERTFALNHLGYFLITNLLLDLLVESAPSRIVNVSSGGHFGKPVDFDDLQLEKGYNPMEAYGRSKFANILFTYELDRRLVGKDVTVNTMNPSLVATNIWKNVGPIIGPLVNWWVSRRAQTPEEGAQGVIFLASSPQVAGVSGKYYRKTVEMESDPLTYDPQIAQRLWEVSASMTGLET